MTILPAAGFMNDDARTQGEMKTAFEDQRQVIEDLHGVDSTKAPTGKNALVNGGFRVVQRGTSFTSTSTPANDDDTYLLDRWLLLSDGDDIVDVSQETTVVPSGAFAAIVNRDTTPDGSAELTVFGFGVPQVLSAPYSEEPGPGCWSWMPYQKAKAETADGNQSESAEPRP